MDLLPQSFADALTAFAVAGGLVGGVLLFSAMLTQITLDLFED